MSRTPLTGFTISDRDVLLAKLAEHDTALDTVDAPGYEDVVLASSTAVSGSTAVSFLETTATVSGVLGNGVFVGQRKAIYQSVAASTPVGTVAGAFKTAAGVAKTSLALGAAVALAFDGFWDGSHWRQIAGSGTLS